MPPHHVDSNQELTSGGAEPVSVGREGKGVYGVAAIQRIKMFAFVKIPEHGLAVLATGSAKRTVGRHGHRVQVTRVTDVVRLQLAVGQVPHLIRVETERRDRQKGQSRHGNTEIGHALWSKIEKNTDMTAMQSFSFQRARE